MEGEQKHRCDQKPMVGSRVAIKAVSKDRLTNTCGSLLTEHTCIGDKIRIRMMTHLFNDLSFPEEMLCVLGLDESTLDAAHNGHIRNKEVLTGI